jgi:hypothetical protein
MAMFWKKVFSLIFGVALVVALTGTVQAQMTDFVDGAPAFEPADDNDVFVIKNRLDFADLETYPAGGVTSASVVQLLNVPANSYITAVYATVSTQWGTSGETAACIIGDGSDTNGYMTALDLGPTSTGVSKSAGAYFDAGRYYSSADTIDLVVDTLRGSKAARTDLRSAVTDAVIDIMAIGYTAPTKKHYGTLR